MDDSNINLSQEYKFEDETYPNPNQYEHTAERGEVFEDDFIIEEERPENEDEYFNLSRTHSRDQQLKHQVIENSIRKQLSEESNKYPKENLVLNKNIDVNKLLSEASVNNIELFSNKIINKPKVSVLDESNNEQEKRNEQKSVNTKHFVEFDLYSDAKKRKEKQEKFEEYNKIERYINSTKHKISNKSYEISVHKIEKCIDAAFLKFSDPKAKDQIGFFQLGQVLNELNLFRETFTEKNSKIHDHSEKYEKRNEKELLFIEQLWIILNPEGKSLIKIELVKEFLKILFSPLSNSIKEMAHLLNKILNISFFLGNISLNNNVSYTSPLSERIISKDEVWSLEHLVKEFLELKENIIAYKHIKQLKANKKSELQKKLNENFTFKPKINSTILVKSTFEERLNKFLEAKQEKINIKKQHYEHEQIKECVFKPDINKATVKIKQKFSNKSEISIDQKKCYERLYNLHSKHKKYLEEMREAHKRQLAAKEDEICTFTPQIADLNESIFENKMNENEFSIYENKVRDIRNGIIKTFREKYKKPVFVSGKNWKKVKNAKIQPFNITDLKQKDNNETTEKDDEEYFSIQITIPNGKEKILKISKSDDYEEVAENFCKIYGLKDEIKQRLTKTINHFVNLYLSKQADDSQASQEVENDYDQ